MRKAIKSAAKLISLCLISTIICAHSVMICLAEDKHPHWTAALPCTQDELNWAGTPVLKKTTAYCCGTTTATGKKVRRGICAGRREDLGKTVIAYYVNEDGGIGDFLGIWEIEDVGFGADSDGDGIGSIQEGIVLDMYFPTLEECKLWMRDTGGEIYVQIIPGYG